MPTYQYRCTECGNELEAVQRFSDPSLTECPSCAGHLRKVFNAVGVVFKGSGFYRTDSRTDAKKANGSTSTNGGSDSSSGEKSSPAEKSTGKSVEKSGAKQPATAGAASGSGSSNSASSTAA